MDARYSRVFWERVNIDGLCLVVAAVVGFNSWNRDSFLNIGFL